MSGDQQQAQMMAIQAMMLRMAAAHHQQQQQLQGGGATSGDTPNPLAALSAMMNKEGALNMGASDADSNALQQRQQLVQMFMQKAAAASAAASGSGSDQHGASGHGHSHGGAPCSGHGHSHDGSSGGVMSNKELAEHQMMMAMHQQMNHMRKQHQQCNSTGYILQHPEASQGPRESYLYGGGHYTPPIFGWGPLAKGYMDPQELTEPSQKAPQPAENLQEKLALMMQGKSSVSLNNVWLFTLPFLGRLRLVKDKMGMFQASCVFLYWLYGNFATWNVVLIPQYSEGRLSVIVPLGE